MTDKKILLLALLFLAGCASDPMEESGGKEAPAAAMRKIVNAPANAARGELLIYFDGDAVGDVEQTAAAAAITRTAATRSGIAPVDDIFTQLGVTSLRRVFPCNPAAEERTRAAGLHKWYIVTFGEEVDLDAAARRLAAVSEVSFVQFNTKLQLASDNRACPYRGGGAGPRAAAGGFNDPGYKDQWHYSNNGDRIFAETTRAGADINVEEAWKLAASAVDPDNYRVTINAHNGYNVYATNGVHYVLAKEGDTFENIGKKFRISARNLRKFNDLKDKKAQPMPHEVVYIERKKKRWEGNAHTHTCRQGETAYAVGQSYAIRTRSIEKLNKLRPGDTLEQGRQIRIK